MMKTLVTVGPNSLNVDDLLYFVGKTKLFRLNGSHGSIEWHKKAIEMIKNKEKVRLPNMDSLMTYYSFPTRKDVIEFYRKGKSFY